MNITWKVDAKETGKFASFQKRGWPSAYYKSGAVCAQIICEDAYSSRVAKEGRHATLKLMIADHSVTPWQYRTASGRFTTLAEAKAALENLLTRHLHFVPNTTAEVKQ